MKLLADDDTEAAPGDSGRGAAPRADDHEGLPQPARRDRQRRVHAPTDFSAPATSAGSTTKGFLHITGRKKDVIIVAGEKVYPREIEELLVQQPDIAEAAVVSRPDESRGEAVVAFVVAKEGHTVTLDGVRTHLREHGMVNWKMPKDLHVVEEFPRSPTGKVLKRELAARLAAN